MILNLFVGVGVAKRRERNECRHSAAAERERDRAAARTRRPISFAPLVSKEKADKHGVGRVTPYALFTACCFKLFRQMFLFLDKMRYGAKNFPFK